MLLNLNTWQRMTLLTMVNNVRGDLRTRLSTAVLIVLDLVAVGAEQLVLAWRRLHDLVVIPISRRGGEPLLPAPAQNVVYLKHSPVINPTAPAYPAEMFDNPKAPRQPPSLAVWLHVRRYLFFARLAVRLLDDGYLLRLRGAPGLVLRKKLFFVRLVVSLLIGTSLFLVRFVVGAFGRFLLLCTLGHVQSILHPALSSKGAQLTVGAA